VPATNKFANLFLIGYRGAGKSTVARRLAELLRWRSVDLDDVIETAAGQSIAALVAAQGWDAFRRREEEALAHVAAASAQVVAIGGGAIESPICRELMAQRGACVWLRIAPSLVAARLAADGQSVERRPPLASTPDDPPGLPRFALRQPLYQDAADLVVDVDGLTNDEAAAAIADWWSQT